MSAPDRNTSAAFLSEREQLDLIAQQIGIYEMSYNDTLGVSAESVVACIANILEYGQPAGEQHA